MREQIEARIRKAIDDHVFPGAVVAVLVDGKRDYIATGRFTYDPGSREVTPATAYDVASITKAVPVALTALHFIEEGKLGLDDQVITYIPEIDVAHAEKALIRHLLTYTYALQKHPDPNFSYEHYTEKDVLDFLFHRPFAFLPGTRHVYSNTPLNLLGLVLERISGEKLYPLSQKTILDPLRMEHSTFHPADKESIPPTEINWRGEVQGIVHDETAYIGQQEGYDPGCAGLFSTADDLLNAAEMMMGKGMFGDQRIFTEETVSLMTTNALADIGEWNSIGWELNQPFFMGSHAHEHMIGKTGFTGTSIVIDPDKARAVVLLSNRTYPHRIQNGATNAVRSDISDIVFGTP